MNKSNFKKIAGWELEEIKYEPPHNKHKAKAMLQIFEIRNYFYCYISKKSSFLQ